MDKVKIFLEDGNEKLVNCIFYVYNSKYYFLYTLNEVDENGYVRLYLVKVGKETSNTANGPVETGNMVGIEVPTDEEWKEVQGSISKIVNSKKTKIEDKDIQYVPIDMLKNLKVMSKKTFRLLSNIIENDFGVNINEELNKPVDSNTLNDPNMNKPIEELNEQNDTQQIIPTEPEIASTVENSSTVSNEVPIEKDTTEESNENLAEAGQATSLNETKENEETVDDDNSDIIIDYRTRFFEEQEKNRNLKEEISKLKKKIEDIENIIKES